MISTAYIHPGAERYDTNSHEIPNPSAMGMARVNMAWEMMLKIYKALTSFLYTNSSSLKNTNFPHIIYYTKLTSKSRSISKVKILTCAIPNNSTINWLVFCAKPTSAKNGYCYHKDRKYPLILYLAIRADFVFSGRNTKMRLKGF